MASAPRFQVAAIRRSVSGGRLVARMLRAEGVEVVFGIIDGTYYGLYRSLPEEGIRLVTPRHETSALHMAAAYARTTGRLGVAMASNGPGVANALPGVAVEQGEGNRVLLVTSSRRLGIQSPDRGGAYQCFPQTAVTGAMCKWSGTVPSRERLVEQGHKALRACFSGRPGVVHLDVSEELMNGDGPDDPAAGAPPARYRRTAPLVPDPAQVRDAAALLGAARQPLIHAGSGVLHAGAGAELERLAELIAAPVTTSWAARGVLPEPHPHSIPMIHTALNDAVRNAADAVLVVGSRLGETDWWGKPPNWAPADRQRIVQVDVDEAVLGLNRPTEIAMLADARLALAAIAEAVESAPGADLAGRRAQLAAWRGDAAADRTKLDGRLEQHRRGEGVPPAVVPRACQAVLPDDAIWVFDGGNTSVWAQFFHEARVPGALLSTFKFGMLGAGVAQALGAKVAHPGRAVCCVIGDGAMGMHPQEVETAVRHGLPVVYVVLCDRQWGMVKLSQQVAASPLRAVARMKLAHKPLPEDEVIFADLGEIAFDELARSMGAHGERVRSTGELEPALRRSLESGRPAVVHVDVDRVEHMWPPGLRTFKKMHEEPSG